MPEPEPEREIELRDYTDNCILNSEYAETDHPLPTPWPHAARTARIGSAPAPEQAAHTKETDMTHPCACTCQSEPLVDQHRRKVIQIAAAGLAAPLALAPDGARAAGPARGDRLVEEDAEGAPTPLRVEDVRPGKPLLAFPFDAQRGAARNDSRLNKVVLMRFAQADLSPEARARSAGGVLAFSAICTHQACDVKTWLSKEKVLVCFCHSSKFALLEDAKVTAGPASRALPYLPLSLEGDQLVVAGPFSGAPGAA